MTKAYLRESTIAVLGAGSWGTVLAQLVAQNCKEVRLWTHGEASAREINSTRGNSKYAPGMQLAGNIRAVSELGRVFENGVQGVLWVLPSKVCRSAARDVAPYFKGDEILIHATKGIEAGSLKRVSEILLDEIPCPRVGVLSGPNLAHEVMRGEPASTVIASRFAEVRAAGMGWLSGPKFLVFEAQDIAGVEWAGALKNILAIASGCLDGLGLGWNARSMLISHGLAEMVRFGLAMGGQVETFLGLAGVGDLLATCSSSLSRNYRVGVALAKGETVEAILAGLGSTAEGVMTAKTVALFAEERGIDMPITSAVHQILDQKITVSQGLDQLLQRRSDASLRGLAKGFYE